MRPPYSPDMKREDLIHFFKPFNKFYLESKNEWTSRGNMGHAFGQFTLKHGWHNYPTDLKTKIDGLYEAMVLLYKFGDKLDYGDFNWWFTMNTCCTESGAFTGGDEIIEPPAHRNNGHLYKNIYYWLKLISN